MIFQKDWLKTFQILQCNSDDGSRIYQTPNGSYPSVTTVLSQVIDHSYLDDWRERIGADKAARITNQANIRGTLIHKLMEDYVAGNENPEKDQLFIHKQSFKSLKKVLDENLEIVHGIEYKTWSDSLKVAGTSDLPCTFQGKKTILDYKTSRRVKYEEDILGYFLQSTCYSVGIYERTGILFPQIAIVMQVDLENKPLVFIKKTEDYFDQVYRLIKKRKIND